MKKRSRSRYLRPGLFAFVVVVVIAVVAGGGKSGNIGRDTAIQNVMNTIDGGPTWETPADSQGVSGYLAFQGSNNGNDGGGGCAYVNGTNAHQGFACYLQASAANGSGEVYFHESPDGSKVEPISTAQYNQQTGG